MALAEKTFHKGMMDFRYSSDFDVRSLVHR